MPQQEPAADLTFAITTTAEALPDDDKRPCVYCNSDLRVEERRHETAQRRADVDDPDALPDDAGFVWADYILPIGHKAGAGVEAPVCDMCINGVPVEYDEQTTRDELEYEYLGKGKVGRTVVEEAKDGTSVHRRIPVDE